MTAHIEFFGRPLDPADAERYAAEVIEFNRTHRMSNRGQLWARELERDARTGLKGDPKEARGQFYGEDVRATRGYTITDLNRAMSLIHPITWGLYSFDAAE